MAREAVRKWCVEDQNDARIIEVRLHGTEGWVSHLIFSGISSIMESEDDLP